MVVWGRASRPSKPSAARQSWATAGLFRYALLTNGFPGETKPTRCSLAVSRSLSLEAEAAARRLRSFAIFSARVRRRRISGRRLGADIKFSLVFSEAISEITSQIDSRCRRPVRSLNYRVDRHCWQRGGRLLLRALSRRTRRLRPISAANQYRQARIFCETRILERKLTHQES